MISTSGISQKQDGRAGFYSSKQRATVWSSVRTRTPLSAHADTEDKKLRKDPFGGPCFEGTLREAIYAKPVAFRMKSRGRDD